MRLSKHVSRLTVCGMLLLGTVALSASGAAAQGFSATNLQLLYGTGFDDAYYGNETVDERMTTLTFEHLRVFSGGDLYFFADLLYGDFVAAGSDRRLYSEVHLRVSPVQLAGAALEGFVRDVLVAGEINRDGNGFTANMIGLGVDLNVPGFAAASINVYYRDDDFNDGTFQVTGVWNIPFDLGGLGGSLEGFADVYGTEVDGLDLLMQPQLMVHLPTLPLSVGAEVYVHTNDLVTVLAPQVVAKWHF